MAQMCLFSPVISSRQPASQEQQKRRWARAFLDSKAQEEGRNEDSGSNDDNKATPQDAKFITADDKEETEVRTQSEHGNTEASLW